MGFGEGGGGGGSRGQGEERAIEGEEKVFLNQTVRGTLWEGQVLTKNEMH